MDECERPNEIRTTYMDTRGGTLGWTRAFSSRDMEHSVRNGGSIWTPCSARLAVTVGLEGVPLNWERCGWTWLELDCVSVKGTRAVSAEYNLSWEDFHE